MPFNLTNVPHFLSKLHIRDRDTGISVPFRLNHNQQVAHQKVLEQANKGRPIRQISVKARRVGYSSFAEGLMTCYNLYKPLINSRIVAHLDDTVDQLFSVPTSLISDLRYQFPQLGIPKPTADKIVIPHDEGNSTLTIATARTTQGGRGGGFYFLHLSEAAFYTSPDSLTSLVNAVPDNPDTAIFIESTAFGKVGIGEAFYKRWEAAIRGDSEYVPVFLSWANDPACIAHPEILKRRPLDAEEREIKKTFKLSDEQLAWRRITIQDKCEGSLDKFRQEFPLFAEEAFISTGNPAFSRDEMLKAHASIREPVFRGFVDRAGKFEASERGPLVVWEKPIIRGKSNEKGGTYDESHIYYLGADGARGLEAGGTDFAAVVVLDGTTNEIVARYMSKVGPEQLAAVIDTLGRQYNNAMAIIELTGNLGLWAQTVLRDKFRYPKFYKWLGRDDKANKNPNKINAIGWETNYRTRELAFTAFREAVREGDLQVRDEVCVSQMDLAQRDMGPSGWQVTHGHDDCLFAALLANIACRQYPPPRRLGSKRPLDNPDEQMKQALPNIRDDYTDMLRRHHKKVVAYNRMKTRIDPLEGI